MSATTRMLPINSSLSINPQPLSMPFSTESHMIDPSRLNYSADIMNSCLYDPTLHHPIQYGSYTPIFVNTTNNIPVVSDDYQSLDCWHNLSTHYSNNKYKQYNLSNTTDYNKPQSYGKQLKQSITTINSNFDLMHNLTLTTPTILLHNNNNNMIINKRTKTHFNNIIKTKENSHNYTGLLKSSFV
ncbi:hypothetical protein MN116_005512 [Schistosoma mekongi]|uniref:Uncharacterized protein n=1 Tax=Schistosoma mekongi TaxID=38744 RepID=A0AAE2D4N8_SCHME|nr:hypothetical protein MN116_005512 [Schistosoma mekongi]